MIDPANITRYGQSKHELEENAVFWVCVAGKTAKVVAQRLENLFREQESKFGVTTRQPFDIIKKVGPRRLPSLLKRHGIGCFNVKGRSVYELATSGLDLATCSVEQLENIYGIGPKTARCFVIHSRENADHAGLDTHLLKFLADMGHDAPKSTPSSKSQYRRCEEWARGYAKKLGMTMAAFDLKVWRVYSGNDEMTRDEFVALAKQK